MELRDRIVEFIARNRVSTTEVADAMGKDGVWPGPKPMAPNLHIVGPIFPVFAANGSNFNVHEQIRDVPRDSAVVVFVENCDDKAIMGELMAKFVLLYRGAKAIIVDGLVRDAARLRRENFAIWARGVTPLGCVNTPAAGFDEAARAKLVAQFQNGIAVCDDGGVVLVPEEWLTTAMLERLELIELQEDVWEFCLNTLKWDTKDVVCDKRYLREPDLLPAAFREKLEALQRGFER